VGHLPVLVEVPLSGAGDLSGAGVLRFAQDDKQYFSVGCAASLGGVQAWARGALL